MAGKAPNEKTVAFRQRMTEARRQSGLSLQAVAARATALLSDDGTWVLGKETIRRMEAGPTTEWTVEPAFLMAIARVYNVPLRHLSERVHKRALRLTRLAIDMRLDRELDRQTD